MNNNKVYSLNVVSFEKIIFNDFVKKIQVSGSEGELGIYPGHLQLLSLIKPGPLLILDDHDYQHVIYISGGIIEVQPTVVSILADTAIRGLDLDLNVVLDKKLKLENKISNVDCIDRNDVIQQLSCELAKLRVIEMFKNQYIKKNN
ncbi:ATP synthase epsilon chain [Buchnera aphidicola str. Bp (Baizongia pistaciae)]|uniref:ATP synthase epsilon chain n=1 Tax=Buchnera aphidicola subsp. Baizongia pistaciae (strain Bp) TaxID=224915 RepID=ATPE_BUCBP|nr:ATP synthase F1 subunit epsilon [Buchnera aphidicola]Q89B38.1 RecName: Full=ATP synthase epsilon chain; AltName: Full=ATP synthase F1 sector epsilon subunit; AltName: Full=F-ATPase epsilon subunit [Buchnera aphidicola str. Bp (Baizongia pistaciae)]AAO26753.1 ATP synthase epsilon chain [Buchnera aphidicola str. Bp (Baizongia pistaciae)]